MSIKERKIKIVKEYYKFSEYLLNICNKIEFNLNYLNNFDYSKYNLNNIHGINENIFSFSYERNYNTFINNCFDMENKIFNEFFSFLYRQLNFIINYLKDIIIMYGKYIKKDILLKIEINNLNLGNNLNSKNNIKEFFSNFGYIIYGY